MITIKSNDGRIKKSTHQNRQLLGISVTSLHWLEEGVYWIQKATQGLIFQATIDKNQFQEVNYDIPTVKNETFLS